jgi:rare lipoprotein A
LTRVFIVLFLLGATGVEAGAQSVGQASYFSYTRFHGFFAAHRTFPIGAHVRVTNLGNGRSATVIVVGRGPFIRSRIIDVSTNAAEELGFRQVGLAHVKIELVEQ